MRPNWTGPWRIERMHGILGEFRYRRWRRVYVDEGGFNKWHMDGPVLP